MIDALDYLIKYRGKDLRKGGLPGICHELSVLRRVHNWGINVECRPTCLLAMFHDLLEDTTLTHEELTKDWGAEVADLVLAMTFRDKLPGESSQDYQTYKTEALTAYKHKPVQCLVVKLADRLCNVEDFFASDEKYALTYYDRAKGLIEAVVNRLDEIKSFYGEDENDNKVVKGILTDIYRTTKLIKQ